MCDIRVIQAQKGVREKVPDSTEKSYVISFFLLIARRIFNQSEFNMMGKSKD